MLLVAGLLGLGSLAAQAQQVNTAKLDSLLNTLAANNKLMGSVALSRNGAVVYSHAFGQAQVQPAVAATPATRYRIGSITKMFTAAMIFQLIEEKKLALTTSPATFFPQLPNAKEITIDQLLSHRSGLHNFTDDPAYESYQTQLKTQAELLTLIAATKPDFAPGAKAAYSNSNFVVLGYVVEKLTKMPYAQAVQKRIATKINLRNTYYGGKTNPQNQEARSYEPNASGWKLAPETDMSIPGGAGALVATPADLDRFLTALFSGQVVTPASLAAMQDIRDGYGRAMFGVPFGDHKGYGHTGGIDAFRSVAAYFPADKLAVALCTNGGTYSPNDALIGVLSIYFGVPYKIPGFQATGFVPAAADLDRYAGTYGNAKFPLKITMTRDGNTLRSQATGQSSFLLEPVSEGRFKFDPAGIGVEFDAAKPAFTLKQGGNVIVFTKE